VATSAGGGDLVDDEHFNAELRLKAEQTTKRAQRTRENKELQAATTLNTTDSKGDLSEEQFREKKSRTSAELAGHPIIGRRPVLSAQRNMPANSRTGARHPALNSASHVVSELPMDFFT
jgi:hypothetical protein